MGHNIFVSYKYSDAVDTREKIRKKLGNEGHFYNGEKGFKALDLADFTIKEFLKNMIFRTSVTVVVISPMVKYSKWVDWEVRYSLRYSSRGSTSSYRNGIVCVIKNCPDFYGNENVSWAKSYNGEYRKDIFPNAVIDNLRKTFPDSIYSLFRIENNEKDYCVVVSESSFMSDPDRYIEEAFRRAHDSTYSVTINKPAL